MIQVSHQIPAIYQRLHDTFGVNWNKGIAICYGDIVYCKIDLGPDVLVHEAVHADQQRKMGIEAWWEKYITDIKFRFEQEVEAYKAQVKWYRGSLYDRELRFKCIKHVVNDLSSAMYGNLCTAEEAKRILHV